MIDLVKVQANFNRRSQHFLHTVTALSSATGVSFRQLDVRVAYVIVELETAMAYATRSAYLAGTVGGRSAKGRRLNGTGIDSVGALCAASKAVGKRAKQIPGRDEPSWASADQVATVAQRENPDNATDIITAMGIFPDARKCVKAFRNFFAHRNEDTFADARNALGTQYGLAFRGHPTHALVHLSLGGGSSILETWIWNYKDIVDALC